MYKMTTCLAALLFTFSITANAGNLITEKTHVINFDKYCVSYIDAVEDIECDMGFFLSGYGYAECNIYAELEDRNTGEIKNYSIEVRENSPAGTGIFQAVGGFVIDGVSAMKQKSDAKKKLKRFVEKEVSRNMCD